MLKQFKINHSITLRTDTLDSYLSQINVFPVLSIDEEVELAKRMAAGDEQARECLVNCNLRFVVSVAKQYQNQGIPLEDLIMDGNMGLIQATQHFDVSRGFKFISYAVWWIRQAIMQSIAEKSRLVRIPLNQVGLQSRVYKASMRFLQENERPATPEELADMLGLPLDKVQDALQLTGTEVSIDKPMGTDSDTTMSETLADSQEPHTDHYVMQDSMQHDISQALSTLNSREQNVLILSFGLQGFQLCGESEPYMGGEQSLEEIGNRLNLTRERVRQIREKAILNLRNHSAMSSLRAYL